MWGQNCTWHLKISFSTIEIPELCMLTFIYLYQLMEKFRFENSLLLKYNCTSMSILSGFVQRYGFNYHIETNHIIFLISKTS